MVYADSLDFYEVRRMGALTGDNMKTLSRCYLPLIGVEALGVYFALYWDLTSATSSVETHESFFRRTLVSSGVFERSLTALEAIGLVKTFRKKEKPASYFVYCIYPPMDAPAFMADPLTSTTLQNVIGNEAFKRLSATVSQTKLPEDMEEETADFASFFQPGFASPIEPPKKKHATGEIPLQFSKEKFLKEFQGIGIDAKLLSSSEIDRCAKIATLYDLDEATLASFCFECFSPRKELGKRLDFEALTKKAEGSLRFSYLRKRNIVKSEVSSANALAQKIQLMDRLSPAAFLGILQGGHRPPQSDLRLLERLYLDIGLPAPCINALVDFVLQKNNNVLSAPYCEKIAGALVREGCQSARDAMDYLLKVDREMKGKPRKKPVKEASNPAKAPQNQEEVSDEEIDALLDDYYGEEGR